MGTHLPSTTSIFMHSNNDVQFDICDLPINFTSTRTSNSQACNSSCVSETFQYLACILTDSYPKQIQYGA